MQGLLDWVLAEPAMFGPQGQQMVPEIRAQWQHTIQEIGMNPLRAADWAELGLDVDRPVYAGAYPARGEDTDALLASVDRTVRDWVDIGEKADLMLALQAARTVGDVEAGLNAEVLRQVRELDPLLGFRVVVPLANHRAFLGAARTSLDRLGYTPIAELGEVARRPDEQVEAFASATSRWPGVLIRADEEVATVDVLFRRFKPQRTLDDDAASVAQRTAARLRRAAADFPRGRPAAPRPPADPVVGVAADQRGASRLAHLRGLQQTLEAARASAVAVRDQVFIDGYIQTMRSQRNWMMGSLALTGVSYGLFLDRPEERYFSLSVTLFGADRGRLPVSEPGIGLRVDQRALALSADLTPVLDESWQQWLGVANPLELVENLSAIDLDPGLMLASFPRTAAILFANGEKLIGGELPEPLARLFETRRLFQRVEFASAGIDVSGFRVRPRGVGLILLDADASEADVDELAEAAGAALNALTTELPGPGEAEAAEEAEEAEGEGSAEDDGQAPPSIDRDQWALVDLPPGSQLAPLRYYFDTGAQPPYLLVAAGLDAQAAADERAGLVRGAEAAARSFYARAEPVALFSLMTTFDPTAFEPLDVGILAQRLGALEFAVAPATVGQAQTVRFDFVLRRPPRLE